MKIKAIIIAMLTKDSISIIAIYLISLYSELIASTVEELKDIVIGLQSMSSFKFSGLHSLLG
jgi:hypothetical protein